MKLGSVRQMRPLKVTRTHVTAATARLRRPLLRSAAVVGTVTLLAGGISGQALAAPKAAAASPSHRLITVRLDASSSAGFVSKTVPLSPSDCAAMKRDKELAPNAACVIGLALSPDARVRQCGPNGTWTTCYDKGTICGGDKPMWGGKNGSVSCAEAYVSVDGRWKCKHPANNHVWILGHVSCPRAAFRGWSVHESFCGRRNNGHPILTMECDFEWGSPTGSGNGYIAIYAHDTGKVTLYGAWNA